MIVRFMSEAVADWSAMHALDGPRRMSSEGHAYTQREDALVGCLCSVHDNIPNSSVMCKQSNLVLLVCALQFPDRPWNAGLAWNPAAHMAGQPLDPPITPSSVFADASIDESGWTSVMRVVELVLTENIRRVTERNAQQPESSGVEWSWTNPRRR